MRKTWPEIAAEMASRRMTDSTLLRAMQDTKARFNGDVSVVLPDVSGEPTLPILTPHLIADVIETTAMRAASTTPGIQCPAIDPSSSRSRERAATRRRALYSTWDYSALSEMLLPRAYRHLVGYGTNCFAVVPDFLDGRARIEIRDPLSAYPSHRSPEDAREPLDVGFIYGRSPQWIMANYPESFDYFHGCISNLASKSGNLARATQRVMDSLWDVVEWIDENQISMGILGPRDEIEVTGGRDFPTGDGFHLRTWDNRAGTVPVAIPRRVTLDRIEGQVSKLTGIVDMMGKLMALDVVAAEKAVFPDMVVLDDTGTPQLLNASGRWNDGRTGEANLVKARSVQMLNSSPGPLTHPVIDRLEGNYRLSSGMPGFAQGNNSNGLRTGNALSTMADISIDPRIQEAQRLMTRALKVVNSSVIAVEKGYFPNAKQVFFSGWPGDRGHVEYTPAKDFESGENTVDYSMPGADINQLTVAIGQAVGTGMISKKAGRQKLPLAESPEEDEKQIFAEQMQDVAIQAFSQQALSGQLPLIDYAEIYEKMFGESEWTKAVKSADKLARERQSAAPETPTAPEAMPGLASPGQGAEAMAPPAIAEPTESSLNFQDLISAMRAGS